MSSFFRPSASKYGDYRKDAVKGMAASRDADVRTSAERLRTGDVSAAAAAALVRKRLTVINTATPEAAELRYALANLDAMIYVEKSSHVGERRIPGAGVIRDANELQVALEKEMRTAGATKESAKDMTFVMSWAAFGKSLDDLIRDQPWVFVGMPHNKRLVAQWLDRAKRLRSGR
jgi:hypothetical protein